MKVRRTVFGEWARFEPDRDAIGDVKSDRLEVVVVVDVANLVLRRDYQDIAEL